MRGWTGGFLNIDSFKGEDGCTAYHRGFCGDWVHAGGLEPDVSEAEVHEVVVTDECPEDVAVAVALHANDFLQVGFELWVGGLCRHRDCEGVAGYRHNL